MVMCLIGREDRRPGSRAGRPGKSTKAIRCEDAVGPVAVLPPLPWGWGSATVPELRFCLPTREATGSIRLGSLAPPQTDRARKKKRPPGKGPAAEVQRENQWKIVTEATRELSQ